MKKVISERVIRDLRPPPKGSRILWDEHQRGLGIRITSNGVRSWVLAYRTAGIERRVTIGRWPDWKVVAAREEARRLRRLIDQGRDPLAEREEQRSAPTVADLAERYRDEHLPNKAPRSRTDDWRILETVVLPRLGRMKVAAVEVDHVEALHRSLSKTPTRANRILALLSKMFSLAVKWRYCDHNPARGIQKNPEQPRDRYLKSDELHRLLEVLGDQADDATDVIHLLILTGARKGEVLGATWDQFDLEGGVWRKPASTTKTRRVHRVPLSKAAVEILRRRKPNATTQWVFPKRGGGGPRTTIQERWQEIRDEAGLDGFRLHDLRHYADFRIMPSRLPQTANASNRAVSRGRAASGTRHNPAVSFS